MIDSSIPRRSNHSDYKSPWNPNLRISSLAFEHLNNATSPSALLEHRSQEMISNNTVLARKGNIHTVAHA